MYNYQLMFYVCAGFVLLSFVLTLLIKHQSVNIIAKSPAAAKGVLLEKNAIRLSLVMFFVSFDYAAIISFLAL